jgi:arylsulfatase A-like enzyme
MKARGAVYLGVVVACVLVLVGVTHVLTGRNHRGSHVVLISIDTLRPDHLGCYGYGVETSPNIDRLAGEGIRFADVFSQSSWTLPSHMSIMTSLYPSVHGVGPSQRALAPSATTLAEVLSTNGYGTAAFVSWVFLDKRYGFGRGFDNYTELWGPPDQPDNPAGGAFPASEVTDHVIRWIKSRQSRAPFFLFVHYFDTHMNYSPPPPFDTMFDHDYSGSASGEWTWIKPYIKWSNKEPESIDARDLKHVVALYDGEVRYVDGQIQRLLDALDDRFGLRNCLVILTSDHGEEFNDHGSMEGHGWTLYDEVLRVPLIVMLPGRDHAGEIVQTPVALIDIAPTILKLLGLPVPPEFQGRDFSDVIRGAGSRHEKRFFFAETYRFNRKRSVRGDRYKLIHTDDTGAGRGGVVWKEDWELFDFVNDPKEQNNLFAPDLPIARLLADRLNQFELHRSEAADRAARLEIPEDDLKLLRSLGYVE